MQDNGARAELPDKFWTNVERTETCWLWLAGRSEGYGRFYWDGPTYFAHRLAYEAANGPIPAGLVIDHLCRVRHCVNPAHMEVVTIRENTMRGLSPGRRCPYGHPEDRLANGRCRTCNRESQVRHRRARGIGPRLVGSRG